MESKKSVVSHGLPGYREIGIFNTYALLPIDIIPKTTWRKFTGDFNWFKRPSVDESETMEKRR